MHFTLTDQPLDKSSIYLMLYVGHIRHVGRLGSEPRLVGRIGSGLRVSASFQKKFLPGSVLCQKKGGDTT